MSIKAIQTVYKGNKFRSRLEARWAVFFDTLNLRYEYEHEGFELPSGRYLPDFWLPDQECWIEIKPDRSINQRDFNRYVELVAFIQKKYKTSSLFLFGGSIELPKFKGYKGAWALEFSKTEDPRLPKTERPPVWVGLDWPMVCFMEDERGEIKLGHHKDDPHAAGRIYFVWSHDWQINTPRLMAAYNAARSARFEFGESGNE